MSDRPSNSLTEVLPSDVIERLSADLALLNLPIEEPFPPSYSAWKTYATYRHINALAAGQDELWAATWGGVVRWQLSEPIKFTRFASEHGLHGHCFHCLALDDEGQPWVGGPNTGVSTFTGTQWRTLTTTEGLPSNDILCLSHSTDGRIWAGTWRGLGYIQPNEETLCWHNFSLAATDIPGEEIQTLAVDIDGTLWLGTDWGLYRLKSDGAVRRYTEQDGLPSLHITRLALHQDRLWVGTTAGLCSLHLDHIEGYPALTTSILELSVEASGLFWVITPEGIGAFTPPNDWQQVLPHPALGGEAHGRAVATTASGQRWFGFTEGITRQHPTSPVLLSANDVNQMSKGENGLDNCISALQVDAIGRIWAGTPSGLWYLERDTWRQCRPGNELSASLINIRTIALSPTTYDVWVGGWREDGAGGTQASGLRRFIGTAEVPLPGPTPNLPFADTLTCDSQGTLWVASENVIYRFDGTRWTDIPLPDEAQGELVQTMAVDSNRALWCGTTAGLWRYQEAWHREAIDDPVQAIATGNNQVWVGTPSGLKKLADTRSHQWIDVTDLPQNSVTALAVRSDGTVATGMISGLALRGGGEESRIFTAANSGLANDFVQCLTFEGNRLWVGTANGLSRFTLER